MNFRNMKAFFDNFTNEIGSAFVGIIALMLFLAFLAWIFPSNSQPIAKPEVGQVIEMQDGGRCFITDASENGVTLRNCKGGAWNSVR